MSPELDTELEDYSRLVLEESAQAEPVPIGSIVNPADVFDFLILYESIAESWEFYPFCLHAFVTGSEAYESLSTLELPNVEVHLLPGEDDDESAVPGQTLRLVEDSGLERCIVSDVHNVFVSETPELFMLLNDSDFVFVGAPDDRHIVTTNLWSFRRNERSIDFARRWQEESAHRELGDGLASALWHSREKDLKIKVLARSKPDQESRHSPSPYDVQAGARSFYLGKDPLELGFREAEMGRAKVIHFGPHHEEDVQAQLSLAERLKMVIERFPGALQFLPLYATLAKRAAERLGMNVRASPLIYVEQELDLAGVVRARDKLPELLNRRGLFGRGAEIGVAEGLFSSYLLHEWRGRQLLSVDPWLAASYEEWPDIANLSQKAQDTSYAEAQRRLSPFGERSTIWRMTSLDAAKRIRPDSLDFVYLDARHDYESTREDLEAWFDRVRPGGIIAGHDYVEGDLPEGVFGVQSAVNEFFAGRNLPVKTTALDGPWVSWYVEIPSDETSERETSPPA